MQSYYDILGISQSAGTDQIKAAFRRLAKLYHPDKNPQGEDQFGKILVAYEVLVDPTRRQQYDTKLKYGNAESFKARKTDVPKQKEWSFSDEELKRRQYYKEHYKKEYERYVKHAHVTKKNYNEYKYILFAAPLAVGLLMFIVNTYEQSAAKETKKAVIADEIKYDELKMGDDPFTSYFKDPVFDTVADRTIMIKNFSSKDLIVAMFSKENKFIRSSVIKPSFYIEISQLPEEELNLRFASGKNWNKHKPHNKLNVWGGFMDQENYFILDTKGSNGFFTITDDAINNLDKIEEKDFFKRN
jgi:curved DNA-binding protein CbpA